mgnify:CR=1 FL=1|tara:strand:- start:272 stop:484 length:213 start_codon:yes stop_codon:yes gene_type:complete
MKKTYILKIVFNPETEEVEWLQEEVCSDEYVDEIENGSPLKIINDPFESMLEQMTDEDILMLTSFELGIS